MIVIDQTIIISNDTIAEVMVRSAEDHHKDNVDVDNVYVLKDL